jgi:hypothetical protein
MKINIDRVISSRIKQAWAALSPEQQTRPARREGQSAAVTVSQTRVAPTPDPATGHPLLVAHSAISDDQDGVANSVEAGAVIDVDACGEIWGTRRYQQLDPGCTEAAAVWLEYLIRGKHYPRFRA